VLTRPALPLSRARSYGGLLASAAQVDPSTGETYGIAPGGTDMIVTYGSDGQVAAYNPGDMCVGFPSPSSSILGTSVRCDRDLDLG